MVFIFLLYAFAFLLGIAFIALVWDYAILFRLRIIQRRSAVDANQLKLEKTDTTVADQTTSAATGDDHLSIPTHPKAIPTQSDNSNLTDRYSP